MSEKRISPYTRLLERVRRFAIDVMHPRRRELCIFPKAKLGDVWTMVWLAQRVVAADQLGWDVGLVVTPDGDLRVEYIKRPDIPWDFKP